MLTNLAKKGWLGQDAQEQNEEKYEELYSNAKNVGMPKMPAKELKATILMFTDGKAHTLSAEKKLAVALPLARKYPAEERLWYHVMRFAEELAQWPLVLEAAKNVGRLTPPRDRPSGTSSLVLALHRMGRDEEALAALTAALQVPINVNSGRTWLVPAEADLAFRQRAWVIASGFATQLLFRDYDVWWERGLAATDPAERVLAFETILAMCERQYDAERASFGKDYKDHAVERYIEKTQMQLEMDRIAQLTGEAKVDALMAAAKRFKRGQRREPLAARRDVRRGPRVLEASRRGRRQADRVLELPT